METLTMERLAFPDPASNLDEEDIKLGGKATDFASVKMMKKWMKRAHGYNDISQKMYRLGKQCILMK